MTIRRLGRVAIVAGVLAFSTTNASALTLAITGGGLDATESFGCPESVPACSLTASDYSLESSSGVFGQIIVDETGPAAEVRVSLFLADATFDGPGGPIHFESVSYSATMSGFYASTTFVGPGTGSIDRGFGPSRVFGRANDIPFDLGDAPWINIVCSYPGGTTGQCGISFGADLFGAVGFMNLLGQDWVHTFDLDVQGLPPPVTEPVTALLLALGFAGLALRARVP